MIGRLVRAIRPGDPSRHGGREARGARRADDSDAGREYDDHENDDGTVVADRDDEAQGMLADFLDPDERILVLLSESDGRMWQQAVVERTDYSAARVSELLGEMEAEGRINRYPKDGEKVVSFQELGPE